MRYVILGDTAIVKSFASGLIDSYETVVGIVQSPVEFRPLNTCDMGQFADGMGAEYHQLRDVNTAESIWMIDTMKPDYIIASWHRMIELPLIQLPVHGIIGTHPTRLPFGRGRHPLHWLIAEGIEDTAMSFFRMTPGMDDGNILWQEPFYLPFGTTIARAHERANHAAYVGIRWLAKLLKEKPDMVGKPQNHKKATYFRKRTEADCTITDDMDSNRIVRLVNSYSSPFPCARYGEARVSQARLNDDGSVELQDTGGQWFTIKRPEPIPA